MAMGLEFSNALVIVPVLCITIALIWAILKCFSIPKAKPSDPLCVILPSTQHITPIDRFHGPPPSPRGPPTGRFLNTACTTT
ncbi:hypothetical protein Forpe1208_v008801 [Fusarium oxysporum f. sp. rapae]|uniref:Uncharacterized protein n=1 Tax=Fusarium oxysporum f. sp. rapae TaxID=485398 RepID=A0A8J5TUE1_FUSOX|nr:hypothetical protein Forpe1208_v008801 [Fusarium oxysporum f. sp. rapae]